MTGARFRLEKTNARTSAPTDPTRNILAGEQRTDGFELGLAGELLPDRNLSATYAHLDAELTKSNNLANGSVNKRSKSRQGKTPADAPKDSGVVWTSYNIAPEWEVGGVFMSSSGFADSFDEMTLTRYARLDTTVAYRQKHFDIQTNAFNPMAPRITTNHLRR